MRLAIISVIVLSMVSCASRAAEPMLEYAPAFTMVAPAAAPDLTYKEAYEESMYEGTIADSGITSSLPANQNRIVIKNASLSIVVKDPAITMDAITEMADDMGGFVVNSNLYKTYTQDGVEVPEATITIRVPAEKLDQALDQIKSNVEDPDKDIQSENVQGSDVTSEYTDLQSRLKNLQNTEARLNDIMDSATKTEDILAVHNELTRVGEEIEVIKGQIKYYDEAAALSAISVNIVAQESITPLTVGGWEPRGIAKDALQALINALKFFASAAIWIVLFFIPVLSIVALPFLGLFFLIRWIVRKQKQRKASRQIQSAEKAAPKEEKTK